ncbi:wall-associated receptor kinase-like 16 [Canna indica]|uniref:Wall-associated receptor kinase-like 16 n=1 Tax=Canna indica TaxID=4628 RepID=A0AAQ3L0N4_9LILI|nr:wall-associated receptor kinase-like 16 [Canna indica]
MCNLHHLFQLLCLMIFVAALKATTTTTTLMPSCQSHCGNVSIPYPFGIGAGCHIQGFDILCNTTFHPPRPFVGDTGAELIDISLIPGEARVYEHIDWVCYNETSLVDYEFLSVNLTTRPVYKISSTRNKFTGVGCYTLAYVGGDIGNPNYLSGCVTSCDSLASAMNETCAGSGCCQTTLPKGLTSVVTGFAIGLNNTVVWDFNPCSYAFVVEQDWYNFTSADLMFGHLNSTNQKGVPTVLDWAIGNQTCEEARRNSTSYACVDKNSECLNSTNGPGYRCNCSRGYEGNPYLSNGCRDIDECEGPLDQYPCYGICRNTPGNYTCSCPRGKQDGDPYTKDGCRSTGSSFPLALKILIATMCSIFFVTVMSFGIYLGLQKRKLIQIKQSFFEKNGGSILQQQINSFQGATFKLFTLEELEKATNKFDDKLVIGRGGHGIVYKGTLEDKRTVAIKKSKLMDEGQTQEFAREMLILSQINHRNVIKILGCCLEVEVPMLVYEFIPNGTLFQYLHDKIHKISIPLDARLRIAEESASALAYLHSAASPPIIHGDVKSSNILLDEEYSTKVSDFGASKLAPKDEAQFATVVQGTCGYLDPEYLLTCQLTEKSDVYSFGVVILELLTRMKPFEFDATGQEKILASIFFVAMKEDKIENILDNELKVGVDMVLIKEFSKVAMQCLNFTRDERPTMKEVAQSLETLRKSKHHVAAPSNQQIVHLDQDDRVENTMSQEFVYTHDATGSGNMEILSLLDVGNGR